MTTSVANLDTTQYVKVNIGLNPITLQAHRDAVRIVFSDAKPAKSNTAFHILGGDDQPFILPFNDVGVWALATTEHSSLVLTEFTQHDPGATSQGSKDAFVTEFGELTVGMRIHDVSNNFHYGVSTKDTRDKSTGTGSVSDVGSDAAIQCGVGVGTGRLESLDAVRYRAGHESLTMITHDQTEFQNGVDVIHGLLNDDDGIAIGSQGVTPGLWFIEGGNENFTAQTDWNVDKLNGTGPSGFNLDLTQRNLFAITFGYLSIAPIRFYCHTGAKGWVEFHNIILGNTQAEGHLKNPTLPVSCVVRRVSGSGDDVQVKTGSWRAGTIGPERQVNAADRWFDFTASRINLGSIDVGVTPNLYHNVFTLKSADLFNGKNNHIRSEVSVVSFVVDANRSVEFVGVVNGALVGNDAFIDKDANNSVMSTSINGTVEGPTSGAATLLSKTSDRRTNVRGTGIFIRPGLQFTLGARGINGSSVTGDISASFRWVEEF